MGHWGGGEGVAVEKDGSQRKGGCGREWWAGGGGGGTGETCGRDGGGSVPRCRVRGRFAGAHVWSAGRGATHGQQPESMQFDVGANVNLACPMALDGLVPTHHATHGTYGRPHAPGASPTSPSTHRFATMEKPSPQPICRCIPTPSCGGGSWSVWEGRGGAGVRDVLFPWEAGGGWDCGSGCRAAGSSYWASCSAFARLGAR